MQDLLKGGSMIISRTNFQKPRPVLIKTTPIFARCSEKQLALPVNRQKILQRLAKVSLSHSFLSSLTRKGGFHLACHQYYFLVIDPAQRGVPWNPRNHPKSATVKTCWSTN